VEYVLIHCVNPLSSIANSELFCTRMQHYKHKNTHIHTKHTTQHIHMHSTHTTQRLVPTKETLVQ